MELTATLMSHNVVSGIGKASNKPYTMCIVNILYQTAEGELGAAEKAIFPPKGGTADFFSGLANGTKYLFTLKPKTDKTGRLDFDVVSFKKA